MKDRFLIKIIPPAGSAVYRFHFRRSHLALLAGLVLVVIGGLYAAHVGQLRAASADIVRLRAQDLEEQHRLEAIDRQAQALQKQNMESARTIEAIRRALGDRNARADAKSARIHATLEHERADAVTLALRLRRLERAEAETREQTGRLSRLAARVLNMRRLASTARARMLAAIPSLNPVNGGINAAFGYRTDPFPEFHKGLDLAADYGTIVHAAAAGTVASAGWDGSFGIKVDVDHGNGYHTWYCHLSRIGVTAGTHVEKGAAIGAVGSTGESTGPHLHYQVMHDGVAVDPLPYLNGVSPRTLATLRDDSGVQ